MTIAGNRFEDLLLRAYWHGRRGDGWWFPEFAIGDGTAARRRIDAVVLPASPARLSTDHADRDAFLESVTGAPVEIVEVKRRLNTAVIGQLLCGSAMFDALAPGHGPITLTALVHRAPDAALRWFCYTERIRIIEIEARRSQEHS
jgi:hypothetical protein